VSVPSWDLDFQRQYALVFFVFSELRCDKLGLNFSLIHRRLKCEELITLDTDDAFMWPLAN